MATSPNLPLGEFITTLNGKRCTAVPRTDVSTQTLSTTPLTTSLAATTSLAVTTAPAAVTSSQVAATPPQSEVLQSDSQTAAPFTTIGTAAGQLSSTSTDAAGSTTTVVAIPSSSGGGNGNGSTAAVAGGVIGGVALVSLIAFFLWFWRRRVLKKRRSTLLTPLSTESGPGSGYGRGEKNAYFIRRDSIGPTPRAAKVKAALVAQYDRVRGRFATISGGASIRSTPTSHATSRSVDMNRGNSQFMDTSPVMGRNGKGSPAFSHASGGDMSIKERIMELWSRLSGGPRTREAGYGEKNDIFAARGISGDAAKKATPKTRPLTNKPDFLTLLNMDDNELDREAQRRRISRTRGGSEGSGIGALNLNFGEDPFSDANAINNNLKVAPLVVSGANNPFSDANAIEASSGPRKPSTYLQDIRRSRGQSVDASSIDLNKVYALQGLRIVNESSRPPSGATATGPRGSTFYFRDSRASVGSFESFATKRNKFRSDPFDLEPLSQVSGSIPDAPPPAIPSTNFATAGAGTGVGALGGSKPSYTQYQQGVARPPAAHTRQLSDVSSRYSGVSNNGTLDDWSEPGPDVGPAARGQWDASRRSSMADSYNPYSNRDESQKASKADGVKMGYAL